MVSLLICLLLCLICLADCLCSGIAWLGLRAWPGRVWRAVLARSSQAIAGRWTFRLWRALPAPTARGRASTRCRRAETRRMRCAGPAVVGVLAGSTSLGRAGACGTCSARRALASARWTIGGARQRRAMGSRGTTRCCKKFARRARMRACVPWARSSSSGARAWARSIRCAGVHSLGWRVPAGPVHGRVQRLSGLCVPEFHAVRAWAVPGQVVEAGGRGVHGLHGLRWAWAGHTGAVRDVLGYCLRGRAVRGWAWFLFWTVLLSVCWWELDWPVLSLPGTPAFVCVVLGV